MNQPTTAAMTATTVPASSALTMNWYSKSWPRSGMARAVNVRRLRLADDHQPPVGGAQHLDGHAVEARQRGTRDHLVRATDGGGPTGEVHDPVEVGLYGIHVVP